MTQISVRKGDHLASRGHSMIRLFLFCLVTVGAFANIEGRSAALAEPPGFSAARMSGQWANLHSPRNRYYGAERPDGYYGYGYYQPYRPYKYSRP